ncbi:hypothetical protein LLG10_06055 [bacterium]|nr:hypothetical protein [bacterium]
MKKFLIVMFLLISICLVSTACKEEKKAGSDNVSTTIDDIYPNNDPIPPQATDKRVFCNNGYLFKASYSDKLQIKQFNFDTLKEELIGELNSSFGFPQEFLRNPNIVDEFNNVAFGFSHLVISPDKKKLAFLGESPRRDFYEKNYFDFPYDLYAMNVDGSDIKRITFDMEFIPYGEGSDLRILFTPDSQEIIIYGLNWRNFLEEAIYIVNIIHNTCVKYDKNHELFWPVFSYVEHNSQVCKTKTFAQSYIEDFPILSYGENYLVWYQNEIGALNWKHKEYKKIYSMPAEESTIWSASWFPDFSKIFFMDKDKLFIYNLNSRNS